MFNLGSIVGSLAAIGCYEERTGLPAEKWVEFYANSGALSVNQARQIREKKQYDCVGCGAPLFGLINENCQYCKRPAST